MSHALLFAALVLTQDPGSVQISELGLINDLTEKHPYRVRPYLRVARQLQEMKECARVRHLKRWARDEANSDRVVILCRMLFAAKEGQEFRRPYIGGPHFFGKTTMHDWPLEPITIVDGVPFLVAAGYTLGGTPEPADLYLKYCLEDCEWRAIRYKDHSDDELRSRVEKLVKSPRWKQPLSKGQIQLFADQIK